MTTDSHDPLWQRPGGAGPDTTRPASGAPAARSGTSVVDPEDDELLAGRYGGDHVTTAIPRWDRATGSASAYGLLGEPEPLPYVSPARTAPRATAPAEIEPEDPFLEDRVRDAGRRGTQDAGLLLLRLAAGGLLVAQGLRDAFGLWGGTGVDGLRTSLENIGLGHADVLSWVFPAVELLSGALLVLGVFTPAAAALALAHLTTVVLAGVAAQRDTGTVTSLLPSGAEHTIFVAMTLAAITLCGPGRWGFDAGRGWARRPFVGSAAALVLGVGAGVGLWALVGTGNPLG